MPSNSGRELHARLPGPHGIMDCRELPQEPFRRHPWERVRLHFFERVLAATGIRRAPHRVLDVGAGDAWFARRLMERMPARAQVTCWDPTYTPEFLARLRSEDGPAIRCTAKLPEERFDVLLLLDVLEHVPDDGAFLEQIVSGHAVERAWVLVSVPAWQALYSEHDRALGHLRRYSPSACAGLLRAAGLVPELHGGLFHSLLLPRALVKLKERLSGKLRRPAHVGEWSGGWVVTRLAEASLLLDSGVSYVLAQGGLELPGLSWWALCRARR